MCAGIFKRMIEETRDYIKALPNGAGKLKMLDARMGRLLDVGFVGQLRFPSDFWVSGSSVQANEYRAVMQVNESFRRFQETKMKQFCFSRLFQ